jgi:hypothetical protein
MSTVAKNIKDELYEKSGIETEILNLIDFYVPLRGNLRREGRSRAGSIVIEGNEEHKEEIIQEIKTIN